MAIGKPQLIIESNSIGLGYYADNGGAPNYLPIGSPPFTDGWANVMYSALGGAAAWDITNTSINGGKTGDLTAADPTAGYPLLSSTRHANVVFFFEVTNDYFISNTPIATCFANYQAWYNGWRAATNGKGVGGNTIIIFGTPIPRSGATADTWEQDRIWIRQQVQAAGMADEFCDFGFDPVMGAPAQIANATYWRPASVGDAIHPLLAGHAILGKIAAAAVRRAMSRMALLYSTLSAAQTAQATIDAAAGYPKADPLAGGLVSPRTQHYCPIRPYGTQYALLADATTLAALASPPQPILLPPGYGA